MHSICTQHSIYSFGFDAPYNEQISIYNIIYKLFYNINHSLILVISNVVTRIVNLVIIN